MSLEMFMGGSAAAAVVVRQPHMKVCTKCKTLYPATAEYFCREKSSHPGLRTECKECQNERGRAWRKNGGNEKIHKHKHEKSPHRNALCSLRARLKSEGKRKFLLGEAGTPEAEAYIEYLKTITHCPDCAKEMVWYSEGRTNLDSASFDRIDSNGDYTKENVRIVCRHCNIRKSDSPVDEWIGQLEKRVLKGIIESVDEKLIGWCTENKVALY